MALSWVGPSFILVGNGYRVVVKTISSFITHSLRLYIQPEHPFRAVPGTEGTQKTDETEPGALEFMFMGEG